MSGANLMLVPLNPRVAARVARRQERALATAYYESKADAEHRESMRDMEHADRRRAEKDDAEARRAQEEHRAREKEDEAKKRRLAAQHDRNNRARLGLARTRERSAGAAAILGVAIVAALWGGREHVVAALKRLGIGAGGGRPTPENVGAIQAAIVNLIEGDDGQAVELAWQVEQQDYQEALDETFAEMQAQVEAASGGTNPQTAAAIAEQQAAEAQAEEVLALVSGGHRKARR